MSSKVLSPFEQYVNSGDKLLSVDMLMSIQDNLTQNPNQSTTRRANSLLIAAEACIDIAVQSDKPDLWTTNATDILDGLIENEHERRDSGNTKKFAKVSQTLVTAYIRRAETHNWSRAADGLNVVANYGFVLNAGRLAAKLCDMKLEGVDGRTIEHIPIILGSRAVHRGMPEAWYSRTALQREDLSLVNSKSHNPNWDIGVSLSDSASQYINPEIKLQSTRTSRKTVSKYKNAGVHVIIAKKYGIDNPSRIIYSCLNELGIRPPDHAAAEVMPSNRLDDITGNMHELFVSLGGNMPTTQK